MLARRPDSLATTAAYAKRLRLYRGELSPDALQSMIDVNVFGTWFVVRGAIDLLRVGQLADRRQNFY